VDTFSKSSSKRIRVYRPKWGTMHVALVFAVLGLMIRPLLDREAIDIDDLFLSIPYLVVVALLAFPVFYERIVVSENGLEFFQVGYRYSTTWDNIDRITTAQIGLKHGAVLLLRKPALKTNRWLAWLSRNEAEWLEQNGQFIPQGQAIPLFLFLPNWQCDALGKDIRHCAPQLFAITTQG
jgi:hypothetical protein